MTKSIVANELTRSDTFRCDPFSIKVVEENRGRRLPPTDEQVVDRALSMLEYGQLEPVECRKEPADKSLVLNSGFTRVAASRLIRQGFTDAEGNFHKDEHFKVWVAVTNCNEEDGFIRNIIENAERNDTSAIDDAHNQERLRNRYGKSDAEIAKIYHYHDTQKVYRLKRLLALDFSTQELVHYGKLTVAGALDLLDMPEDERQAVIEAAKNEKGEVKTALIREAVRSRILNDDELPENVTLTGKPEGVGDGEEGEINIAEPPVTDEEPANNGVKAKSRSMREIRKFFTSQMEGEDDDSLRRFAKDMLDYIAGKKTDKQMVNSLNRFRQG